MRYLVTGGAGFIGAALVKRLVADGHDVTVLDDFSRGRLDRLRGVPATIVSGDIRKMEHLNRALNSGADAIIHLAYLQGTQTFYSEPRQVLDVALRGMLNILEACERRGITDLMLVSSSEAYQVATVVPTPETVPCSIPDPLNPRYSYGGGKAACEIMLNAWQRTGVLDRAVIARPHNIYGPDMGREHVLPEFCLRLNELDRKQPAGIIEFPIQGTGQETRSFCHITDCVDQLALLLAKAPDGTEIYHLGNMDERAIAEVAHEVADFYGRDIKVIPGSLPKGSPQRRLPDIAKITALGYPGPQVSFADGVAETTAWYRANG